MNTLAQPFNSPATDFQHHDDEVDIRDVFATLIEHRGLIFAVTTMMLAAALFYIIVATPIYKADAIIQVEEKVSDYGEMDELAALLGGETSAISEIEILKTRSVVGDAAKALDLDIVVKPYYFPIIGEAIARRLRGVEASEESFVNNILTSLTRLLGSKYAWSNERLTIGALEVPDVLLGKPLMLVAGENNTYELKDPDGQHIFAGRVGQRVRVADGPYAGLKINVGGLQADPKTQFEVIKHRFVTGVKNLQQRLEVSEKGRDTGVLTIALEGPDKKRVASIVNAVADSYLKQHVERRSEEASKMLTFLNSQLPEIKAQADVAEQALQEHRAQKGTVDLSLEAQQAIANIAEVERQISEIKLEKAELEGKFTPNHPVRKALDQQLAELYARRKAREKELRALPGTEWETLQLERDARVTNELYVLLLNEAQELRIAKAGTIGNVRIVDRAFVPIGPVKPRKALIMILSLVLGLFIGAALSFLRRSLTRAIEDPDQLEHQTGLPVYASVPHSEAQERLNKQQRQSKVSQILSLVEKKDTAVESMRSLRTSLQFASMNAVNNIISVTGPSPAIGKSFICANLAVVLAEAEKRVALIDADMRKGHLHRYFQVDRTNGLSNVIGGEITLEKGLHRTQLENLMFIASGVVPPNPSELLMSRRFEELLGEISGGFDIVVIDTPPMLAVTDAEIIAKQAGVNLVVLRSGIHPIKEIERTVKRFSQNGVVPNGFIFNDVPKRSHVYGYGKYSKYGYHYQYEYK